MVCMLMCFELGFRYVCKILISLKLDMNVLCMEFRWWMTGTAYNTTIGGCIDNLVVYVEDLNGC